MEVDIDSDEDTETELDDIELINKVLKAEDVPLASETSSHSSTIASKISIASSSKEQEELSKIQTALSLNKQLDDKLSRLEKLLLFKLRQCRQKLSEIQGCFRKSRNIEKHDSFRYYICGRPYFKDKSNFPAPDNEDTILMAKSNMYDFSQVLSVPGWTVKDKSQFMLAIHKMSQEVHKEQLLSKIAQIKRENKCKSIEVVEKLIESIHEEIQALNRKPLRELALPIDMEYDWDTLANKLNRRHTAHEYRALWKLFFHPSINKNSWSKREHLSLQEIAKNNNLQDWDDIAKKHNTGRTGYQTFVYYRTNMTNTFTGRKWTSEEVEYVKRLIDYYKEDNYIPWGKVAASMQNRTKIQIYNKYLRLIEERKGRFLPEEDAVILHCVTKFGPNFRTITSYLPGRSIIQLRTRYKVLSKMRISAVWTVQEDKRLIQIMSNQDSLMHFSEITKHFPGKDRANLRSRYLTLVKWMKKFPHLDVSHAPRRGARRLTHGQPSENLVKALENLKNRMQLEVDYKRKKKITIHSSEEDIEDGIVAALVNENIKTYQMEDTERQTCAALAPEQSVASERLNVTNLRKLLIFLNSKLRKDAFTKTHYSQKYPALAVPCSEVSSVTIKSYSRKSSVQNIKLNGYPDVWGNTCLGSLNYVLPPHYATITGCRALMLQVSKVMHEHPIALNVLMRKNNTLKDQVQCLMDRFYTLFVWPMLLSNEGPRDKRFIMEPKTVVPTNYKKGISKMVLPCTPSITMPFVPEDEKFKFDENIDLDYSDDKSNITVDESFSDESFFDV